jgi:hypothetical protein
MNEQDRQRQVNADIAKHVPRSAWDSTVAIVIGRNPVVQQFGTGILFGIAEQSFLVTAGHVFREAKKASATIGFSTGTGSFAVADGNWLCSSKGQYGFDGDPFDVAIYPIPKSTKSKLAGKSFLRFDDIDFEMQSPNCVCCLFGFPGIWSLPSTSESEVVSIKPFEFTTFAYEGDTSALIGYDERFHVLIDAQPRFCKKDDGSIAEFKSLDGTTSVFPRCLGGVSGCSIWRIGDLKTPINEWGRQRPRIVAVQTGVFERGVIKGTRWLAVSTMLYDAFPQIRPAMSLWRRR